MNTNEELINQKNNTQDTDLQKDILGKTINTSKELDSLNDELESDVHDILWESQAIDDLEAQYAQSLLQIKKLEEQIKTLTSVAATSQSQYLTLKNEFESAQRMRSLEKWRDKVSAIISVAKKFVILVQDLKQFLDHLTPELEENELINGLKIVYKNFIDKTLADFGIKQIESLGLVPDAELHEIVMMDAANESDITILNNLGHTWSDFSGHIIREFEIWYYYMDGETRHIIKSAKVVVGQ